MYYIYVFSLTVTLRVQMIVQMVRRRKRMVPRSAGRQRMKKQSQTQKQTRKITSTVHKLFKWNLILAHYNMGQKWTLHVERKYTTFIFLCTKWCDRNKRHWYLSEGKYFYIFLSNFYYTPTLKTMPLLYKSMTIPSFYINPDYICYSFITTLLKRFLKQKTLAIENEKVNF